MILGVGIDIERISRFRKLPYKKNKHFYEKIFTESEIKYSLSKPDPYQHFAARFAAKEAVIKALSHPVDRKDIETIRSLNKPVVLVKKRRNIKILVSISHTRDYAAAISIIVKR